jgi:hypothetical protein
VAFFDKAMKEVLKPLKHHKITIEFGPVIVPEALGKMKSVYIRDPDGKLIERSEYQSHFVPYRRL